MEVEGPEHGIRSWRDFFVHMGTVFLGILLAIGLERATEALHHSYQLAELEKALKQDASKSIRECESNAKSEKEMMQWDESRYVQVANLGGEQGSLAPLPDPPLVFEVYPADAAWHAAVASGLVVEVNPEEIKAYSFLDKLISQMESEYVDLVAATARRGAFEARFPQILTKQSVDAVLLTPEDRKQYLEVLEAELIARSSIVDRLKEISATENLLSEGERDVDRIQEGLRSPKP